MALLLRQSADVGIDKNTVYSHRFAAYQWNPS